MLYQVTTVGDQITIEVRIRVRFYRRTIEPITAALFTPAAIQVPDPEETSNADLLLGGDIERNPGPDEDEDSEDDDDPP